MYISRLLYFKLENTVFSVKYETKLNFIIIFI